MQDTSISLLTREGALRATFHPALDADQYAALLQAIRNDGDTHAEMTELLTKIAIAWGRQVIIDPC
jgi:hypothetical protein